MQAAQRIEQEFDEPLAQVVGGYASMGYSKPLLAEVLEVTEPSLRMFCHRQRIPFRHSPIEHRDISGRPPRIIRHAGREMSLTEWAIEMGVAPCTIHKRLRTRGSPC